MKPNSIVYCSICGNDYKFSESCCDFPKVLSKKKWKKNFSSEEEYEEDFIKKLLNFVFGVVSKLSGMNMDLKRIVLIVKRM